VGQSVTRYDFQERLLWSKGFLGEGIAAILKNRLPNCHKVVKADETEDRQGTDYWALRDGLPKLAIDVKVRSRDYAPEGQDDLALETWSVIDEKIGWTRDAEKRTDYVLWYWQDTGRFCLISFHALCWAFTRHWQAWKRKYKVAIQESSSWQSECVFVPRAVVLGSLARWQTGKARRARS